LTPRVVLMISSVEQLCDEIAERRLLSSTDFSQMRTRWFRPNRTDVNDLEKFARWLTVNGYLTAFVVRMLRNGKAELLRLNQYQLIDHLAGGPFAGAYLALDPLQRRVVLEVLAAERAAKPEAVQAFQVAAEKARSVRHTNINLVLDFGEAQGRHYLVREFDEGETLADVLARRGRLKPITAARFFALALLGLQALHESQVPAGPLNSESFLLSLAGKSARSKARNVKILNAGVSRAQFNPSALDTAVLAALPMDSSELTLPSEPRGDLFRLGITFYHSLTGQLPFPPDAIEAGILRATPIRQLAPDVPELLAQLVESMIETDPAQRPRSAAQAAKSLRVFLASEEETAPSPPEEQLVPHSAAPVSASAPEEVASAPPILEPATEEQPTERGELAQQWKTLWGELRPSQRDWVFLSIGATAVILLVLFLALLTGIRFVNIVCLLTGGVLSFFVERLLRLREG